MAPAAFVLPARFTALDGWRGICALLVASYHFHSTSSLDDALLVKHAYLFVDFFFVLSGFVITYAYLDRLHGVRDAAAMIWRRLARLWPLHLVLLAGFIVLELAEPMIGTLLGVRQSAATSFSPDSSALISAIPTNILMIHGLGLHDRLTWNIPSWSISVELWTYVVFAVIVVGARRWSLWLAAAAAFAGFVVLAAYSTRLIAADHDLGIFRCIYGFFVGQLVYRLVRTVPVHLAAPRWLEPAVVALMLAFVAWAGKTQLEFAAPLVFAVVVTVFAFERGTVSQVLKSQPFKLLGLFSFSIYMIHGLVLALIHRGLTVIEQLAGVTMTVVEAHHGEMIRVVSFGGVWAMNLLTLSYLAAVVGLAALSWRYIEIPAQRWFNDAAPRFLRKAPPTNEKPSAAAPSQAAATALTSERAA